MQEQNIPDKSDQRSKPQNVVITYDAPWPIFSLNFSFGRNNSATLAIGSFLKDIKNYVHILELNEQGKLEQKISFQHTHSPSKIQFNPAWDDNGSDFMTTSGQHLRIFKIIDNQSAELYDELISGNQFRAPLTSMDWNPLQNNLIGTCSIDTSCTVWDIVKGQIYTQFLAHEKEVFDIQFSSERQIFATVGADGTARQFDMRDLKSSQILYETKDKKPICKLAWNKNQQDSNLLAMIEKNKNYVTLIDRRKPQASYHQLRGHRDCVNAIAWAPESPNHICSVSDDGHAYIFDLFRNPPSSCNTPLAEYQIGQKITNLAWSPIREKWMSICFKKKIQLIRV